MKLLHTATFLLLLGAAGVPAVRGQEPDQDREKAKPQQEEDKKKQPPPAPKDKPRPRPDEKQKPDERPKPEADRDKSKTDREQPRREPDKTARQQEPSGRHNGRKIPEEKFRANFGREHHFHVARRDDRHFAYGGYTFEFVEVWPAAWSYDDDFYVEEDGDDYYLVDLLHPEVRILVIIVG
jgi:hypothetical protein